MPMNHDHAFATLTANIAHPPMRDALADNNNPQCRATTMKKDIQGIGLGMASRFAGSEWAEKWGLRHPVEKLAYRSTKLGFKLVGQLQQKQSQKKATDNTPPKPAALLFDVSLTEEQQMIADSLRVFAGDELRPAAHDADEQLHIPDTLLRSSMDMGLNEFAVPESYGGSASQLSPLNSVIIAEQLGWGDFSLAYALLAPVAVANAIARWGSEAQKQALLPAYLTGEPMRSAIAIQEPQPLFSSQSLRTEAKRTRKGFVLNGEKSLVPFAGHADYYLIAAQYNKSMRLFIVPHNSKGVSWQDEPAMGLRAVGTGRLTLNNVSLPANALLGEQETPFDSAVFFALGQLHSGAIAVGTAQAALDYLIPYCNERVAFGEPISHRQSVAFILANIAIELESMRLMIWRAAALAEHGQPFQREAYLAHVLCAEKAMEIGTQAVQLLGGHGFTKEHPAERWYRDLRALASLHSGLHA